MKKTTIAYLKLIFILGPVAFLLVTYSKGIWLAIERMLGVNIPDLFWLVGTLLFLSVFMRLVVRDISAIIEQDKIKKE